LIWEFKFIVQVKIWEICSVGSVKFIVFDSTVRLGGFYGGDQYNTGDGFTNVVRVEYTCNCI
jgi:hypothetical protein